MDLKKAFTSAPILTHVDPQKPFIIEVNTLDFALGSILSQQGDDEKLHPVFFYSRKFDTLEINYEIHDKELLAIVDSFAQWRHFLEGSPHKFIVFSDHKSRAYFRMLVTSSMGPVPHSLQLQDYILSGQATREGKCIIMNLISSTSSR